MKPNPEKDKLVLAALASGEYSVHADGSMWSYRKRPAGRKIKATESDGGYWLVNLTTGGKSIMVYWHRFVALAHLPNPFGLPEVNHKDFDKSNNQKDNLEWSTSLENTRHAIRNGRQGGGRPDLVRLRALALV